MGACKYEVVNKGEENWAEILRERVMGQRLPK